MFVYRNNNTGDVVERSHRDARLEMLPNWETLQEPEPEAEALAGPEPEGPRAQGPEQQDGAETPPTEPPGGGGGDGDGPGAGERPARSANKADWLAYALTRAQDSDEEAAIEGLTKEQLMEQYGSDD
ncbi:hypothetical protein ABZ690_28105 [Streptomyces sp. NPDC006967]|uniref:hypothetical protein n=1 Tax=Streptomyces sp. NPDC006967 TaxID=3156906 RepID=UPI0033D79FDA